jgi:class 3 adenylate cyclase/tetratricopeptide (TPR) repeat protein
MDFYALLDQVIALLRQRQRVTYRALKRQFNIDDDYLEDVKAELIQGQQLAVDEDGVVLVWTGDSASVGAPAAPVLPDQAATAVSDVWLPPRPSAASAPPLPSLAGERRQVTVLFADLSGFTALAETMDPEDVRQVMNACFARLVPLVEAYGGTIDKFIGDAIMALFGAPIAYENDAERAVRTALAMLEALAAFNAEQGTTLGLHCGINTGLVIAGGIGTQTRHDYSVMGDAVNLAARLEDASERGQIFVGAETYRLTHTVFTFEPYRPMAVKGKAEPVPVYRVLGVRAVPSRLDGVDTTRLTPLVGRERERELLLEQWTRIQEGLGQVVLVSGEGGIGKSRLVQALKEQITGTPHTWLECRCSPYYQHTPLYPFIELLERAFGLGSNTAPDVRLSRLEAALGRFDVFLPDAVPLLAAVLALSLGDRYSPLSLSPQQQRQQTLEAVVTVLLAMARQQPMLLIVEDLQWSDPTTQELLALLMNQAPTAPLGILLTSRPEFQAPWPQRSSLTQITLRGLLRPHVEQMAVRVAGDKALPAEVLQQVVAKTDGVPLFVEEFTKTVLESGLLREGEDQYELIGLAPTLAIPVTLHDALLARLDRLATAKDVVQWGAVLGRTFAYNLLQAVSSVDDATLHRELSRLVEAELLYQRGFPPQATYTFKHALIQDAAYQSLLKSTRQQYHQHIAQVLETHFPETVETQPELLAHHALQGEVWGKAVARFRQAGARAYDRAAFHEAVGDFEQAFQALAHLPEHGDTRVLALELRFALAGPLNALGAYGRCLALLGEAEALARALNDRARLGRVLAWMASGLRLVGDYEGAMAAGQQALALAAELGDSALQVEASLHLGHAYHDSGDFGRAAELLRQNVEAADRESGTPRTDVRIWSQAWLARTLSALGAFAEGRRHGEEALRLATLAGGGSTPIVAHRSLGHLYLTQGDLEPAIRVCDQGLALCRASGHQDQLRGIVASLGYASALQGRLAGGRGLLEEAISVTIRTGARQIPHWVAWLSEVCRLAGRGEEAWQHARQALDLARQLKARGEEAHALHQLGVVHAHANPPDVAPAEAHYQQALALAEELGMRPLVAHCHFGLGTLYATAGQREQARAALATAIEMYRAMGMTFWLPQAEATLAQVEE